MSNVCDSTSNPKQDPNDFIDDDYDIFEVTRWQSEEVSSSLVHFKNYLKEKKVKICVQVTFFLKCVQICFSGSQHDNVVRKRGLSPSVFSRFMYHPPPRMQHAIVSQSGKIDCNSLFFSTF